ncbi:MAG: primary-amine oxidase [Pseudomonadota bacterium]
MNKQNISDTVGAYPVDAIMHPLEPLTAAEISAAAALVRADMSDGEGELRFEGIELLEPSKTEVRAFKPGDAIPRAARVSVYRTGRVGVWRYKVSLTENRLLDKEVIPTARPIVQPEEFLTIEGVVKEHPDFIAACAKRGITDMELVCVDPWSAGSFGGDDEEGRHISHTFAWIRSHPDDNLYAHPIEGINAVVDIKTLEVLRVDDHGVVPVPTQDSNYTPDPDTPPRDDLKSIDVTQPNGVSFAMEGRRINWHDWSIVIGFNAREGLTLHDISYAGRPVCYRASIAEMVVPYGSPHPGHARKNVFDIGEYGIGKLANSLKLGCDCLGAIHYLDCFIADINGDPMVIENGICIHEEDHGILWKHFDFRLDTTEVRRARRLVISSISTVGNYEYGSYWYFYLDGEIEFEMKATGIINTIGCEPGEGSKYGTEVSPGVVGQIHQHVFCARLDLSVDGDTNSVIECDTVAEPSGPSNPYGNAFFMQETKLETEGGRQRNPDAQRYWKFASSEKTNFMGKPTAYKLEPTYSTATFHDPEGPSGQRMGFIYNHLWVTPFDEDERFPAGDFVNGSAGGEGLPAFVQQGRNVADTEIVAWHVFGLHHLPRLEDYPVQPVVRTGFKMMPLGFFDRNPNLDMPADKNKASCNAIAAE